MKLQAPIFTLLFFASLSFLVESSQADNKQHPTPKENDYSGLLATAAAGAAVAVGAPLALPFLGFTSAGIVGGSLAASMMAAAAGNGGVVATVGAGMKMAREKVKETFGGEKNN